MKENFEDALAAVLQHEGGFVDHPGDPGGMTNLGCTKRTWEAWIGRQVTEQRMRDLQPSDIAPLYKARYWDLVRGDALPDGLDYVVFDAAINSGPRRASKWVQEIVGAVADGRIGPVTIAAVDRFPDVNALIDAYNAKRLAFMKKAKDGQGNLLWLTFGKGWGRRVAEVTQTTREMTA